MVCSPRLHLKYIGGILELNKIPDMPKVAEEKELEDEDVEVLDADGTPQQSTSRLARYVLVVGTTNRPDTLDAAIRRAGRFDHEIGLGIPDEKCREKILRILCKFVIFLLSLLS